MISSLKNCSACQARIFFLTMESGKQMPVDAEPSEKGNIWIGEDGIGRVVGKGDETTVDVPLYISHFATCSSAKSFRRDK